MHVFFIEPIDKKKSTKYALNQSGEADIKISLDRQALTCYICEQARKLSFRSPTFDVILCRRRRYGCLD